MCTSRSRGANSWRGKRGMPVIRQRGFTLLEMLIAIGLLAMLGVATATALDAGITSHETLTRRIATLEQLQRTQMQIRRDLEQILLREGRDLQGDPITPGLNIFAEDRYSAGQTLISFFKGGRRELNNGRPSSAIERIRYRLDDGKLLRDSSAVLDPWGEDSYHSRLLSEGIDEVSIRFFHDNSWIDSWPPLSTTATTPALPKAIAVELKLSPYGAIEQRVLLADG